MNALLSIARHLAVRALKTADILVQSLGRRLRKSSIDEFKLLSGQGNSRGWRFNRHEIHQR